MSTTAYSLRHLWPLAQGSSSTSGEAVWSRSWGSWLQKDHQGGARGKWEWGTGRRRLSQGPVGREGTHQAQHSKLGGGGSGKRVWEAAPWCLLGVRPRASAEPRELGWRLTEVRVAGLRCQGLRSGRTRRWGGEAAARQVGARPGGTPERRGPQRPFPWGHPPGKQLSGQQQSAPTGRLQKEGETRHLSTLPTNDQSGNVLLPGRPYGAQARGGTPPFRAGLGPLELGEGMTPWAVSQRQAPP